MLLYGSPGGKRARVYANEGMPHLRGVDTEFGLCGSAGMINMGRYVADCSTGCLRPVFGICPAIRD